MTDSIGDYYREREARRNAIRAAIPTGAGNALCDREIAEAAGVSVQDARHVLRHLFQVTGLASDYRDFKDGHVYYWRGPVKSCEYGDPTCPCQDGDQCHYTGPDPWPPPTGSQGDGS